MPASGATPAAPPPPAAPGPGAPIEKSRRAGKYTHPYGGMRRFAEDRAKHSGWDVQCLNSDTAEKRKTERNKVSDALAEQYKEAFIETNLQQGKGRPKANNISAAKKTVKMIAERVLLALEARATQLMFKEFTAVRQKSEVELVKLRQIEACGAQNPLLTYDQVAGMVREKLARQECLSDEFLPGEKLVKPETAVAQDAATQAAIQDMKEFVDDDDAGREALKQALVEMRAEEIAKGTEPTLISAKWVSQITAAANELVQENYAKQYVPAPGAPAGASGAPAPGADAKDGGGSGAVLGCPHFRRKNRVLMACCGTFPVCRMCHFLDQTRIHDIRIEPVDTMLCVMCGSIQPKAQNCDRCRVEFGSYYCHTCGITDDPVGVDLRHCDQCRVCMPGMTFHCELCRACFALPVAEHFSAVHNHQTAGPIGPPPVQDHGVHHAPHPHAHAHAQAHAHAHSHAHVLPPHPPHQPNSHAMAPPPPDPGLPPHEQHAQHPPHGLSPAQGSLTRAVDGTNCFE
jgi:hypothetical protein